MEPDKKLAERALGYNVNPGGTQLFAVLITFLGLAWISIIFRGYVRIIMIKHVSLDDYLMFAAVLIYTGYSVIAIWGIFGGTGEPTAQLTAPQAAQALEGWLLCEVIYAPLSALVRTSIAVFLLRIATQKVHRAIIYTTLAVIWLLSIIYFFLVMFQCSPPSHFWEQVYRKPGSCMDSNVVPAATIAHSVISAVCDFILAILPVAMMWNVQLNKRTKLTIAALLSMGFIAGVALIVRIPYIKFLAISTDFLFETINVAIWSVMEPSLGIIAGCIATLRPLFKAWGIGPSSSARHYAYPSKPRDNGAVGGSSAVWRQSRGMHKLDDELTTKGSKDKLGKVSDSSNSEIELVCSANKDSKLSPSSPNTTAGSWDLDIEQGRRSHADWQVPPAAVFVQTSINITSDSVPNSPTDSASTTKSFPLQGTRTVSVKGPEADVFSEARYARSKP